MSLEDNTLFVQMKNKAEERGYLLTEMNEIGMSISRKRDNWIRHFDTYLSELMKDHEPDEAIRKAEKLADLRDEVISARYPEGEDG